MPVYEYQYDNKTYVTQSANDKISTDDRASEFQDAAFFTKRITRILNSTYDISEIESLMATCWSSVRSMSMCRCLCMILMALLPYQAHAIPELPKTMQGSSICNQDFANKLVGKYNLTDKQILRISQASIVRRIGPNSIITKEYALARVTVTIDPKTKVILKAQCG